MRQPTGFLGPLPSTAAARPREASGRGLSEYKSISFSPPVELVSAFQIITALEEDGTAQKMQLGYRLQQIAAAVENKVTDL